MLQKSIVQQRCGTPFHERTSKLTQTTWWYGWSQYVIPDVFSTVEEEVAAIRTAVAMIDMSPLPKVDFKGPDAIRFFDYLTVRSMAKNSIGHVQYTCWTNEKGALITDGLGFRLAEDHILVSSDTSINWFRQNAKGFDVELVDRTDDYGVLSLQGPQSRAVLTDATGEDWSDFPFCRIRHVMIGGAQVFVARQGFTGELGYEIWVNRTDGTTVWDAIWQAGLAYGVKPAGEYALDVARMEAGLTLASSDYTNIGPDGRSAHVVVRPDETSSPFEVGLGGLVHVNKGDFIGRAALTAEKETGPKRRFVGLELEWQDIVDHYAAKGLPPEIAPRVRWDAMKAQSDGKTIGRATSATWSPTLDKLIAFGCIDIDLTETGTQIVVDWTDQWGKPVGSVRARVVDLPFITVARATA